MTSFIACPCCRSLTLARRYRYQICPVCFWSDDGRSAEFIQDVRGGPNGRLSLREARRNFAAFGACEERLKGLVRPPRPGEMPATGSPVHGAACRGRA